METGQPPTLSCDAASERVLIPTAGIGQPQIARTARAKRRGSAARVLRLRPAPRTAILLIGGNKVGDDRFYERMIPLADRLYDQHLDEIRREGLIR
jgi:hypothetical protein